MPDQVVALEAADPLRHEILSCPEVARALVIADEPSFHGAATWLRRIKTWRATLDRLFAPPIKHAFAAHRALVADRKRLETPLVEAETILKTKLARFAQEEDARRAVEARRQMAVATEARTAAIWAEVEQLEGEGYTAEAADLATELVRTPAPIVVTPPRIVADGLVRREVWKYEVIAETEVPREYLCVDHQKLGAVVRALKSVARIPGVRVWAERTIAASAR